MLRGSIDSCIFPYDIFPGDFDAHVVVASGVPSMRETHPATIARPKIATPVGRTVTIFLADILDQQLLNPGCKTFNSDLANANNNVIVVIVRLDSKRTMFSGKVSRIEEFGLI